MPFCFVISIWRGESSSEYAWNVHSQYSFRNTINHKAMGGKVVQAPSNLPSDRWVEGWREMLVGNYSCWQTLDANRSYEEHPCGNNSGMNM